MTSLLALLGAFLLYVLLLPLFGVLCGLLVRIVLPYALGGVAGYLSVAYLAGWSGTQWLFILMTISWVGAVWHGRFRLKQVRGTLAWYEGHYSGVLATLTLSQSLRLRRLAGR